MSQIYHLIPDYELIQAIRLDEIDDELFINLCAYDNVLSASAAQFLQSPLGNRYRIGAFKGRPPVAIDKTGLVLRRFDHLDELEQRAHVAARRLFGGVGVDLRPLSGVHATIAIMLAVTQPGDTIYSIAPEHGGHFATRHIAERAGRVCRYLAWDTANFNLDIAAIAAQFEQEPPAYLLLDHGIPLTPLKVTELRQAAGPRPLIDYDASHTLGLIAGGRFQNPLQEGCDLLHGNTHKSFPGPQKALIVFKDPAIAQRVQKSLDAGLVSSQHTHHLIALCITLLEMEVWAQDYATQMLANATALQHALQERGYLNGEPSFPATQSHVALIHTPGQEEGYGWFERLRQSHISTNVRPLFGKTIMRLGVQEVTRRGFQERDMRDIAGYIDMAISKPTASEQVKKQVLQKRRHKHPVRYSFDAAGARWMKSPYLQAGI